MVESDRLAFPEESARAVLLILMTHVTAAIGVIAHTGLALSGLGNRLVQISNPVWNLTIGLWLVSLLFVGQRLRGRAYDTPWWQWTSYILAIFTGVGVIHLIYTTGAETIYTDVILFMRYSVDLVLSGQNPYVHPMTPAFDRYQSVLQLPSVTQRADGSRVANISYPALSFLAFVPQRLLGIPNISLTVVVFFILTFWFLLRETPYWLFTVTTTVLFSNQYLVSNAVFGNIDFLWILPLLLGMHYWYRGSLTKSTFAVGVAFAVKPIAWFIAPFTAIWLWKQPERFEQPRFAAIGIALGAGLFGFFIPNAPFIIDAPQAWLLDVFSAAGSRVPFQTRGTGLAVFVRTEAIEIPTAAFRLALLSVLIASMAVYARYFEELKWVAWVMPAFLLWFNDRALFNYYIAFIPVAYYALLLNRGAIPDRPLCSVNQLRALATGTTRVLRELLRRDVDS